MYSRNPANCATPVSATTTTTQQNCFAHSPASSLSSADCTMLPTSSSTYSGVEACSSSNPRLEKPCADCCCPVSGPTSFASSSSSISTCSSSLSSSSLSSSFSSCSSLSSSTTISSSTCPPPLPSLPSYIQLSHPTPSSCQFTCHKSEARSNCSSTSSGLAYNKIMLNNNNNNNNINNTPSSFASTSMSTPVGQEVLQCIVDSVIQDGMDSTCCQDLIPQGMMVELPDTMPDPLEAFIRRTSGIASPIMESPSPSCSSSASSSSSIATPLVACCTGFNAQCPTCGDASSSSLYSSTPSCSQASQSRRAPPSSISLISHEQPFMVGPPMTTPGL